MAKKKLISCKACGEEIAASAKTCPHCGAKNKKPFYKKAWFWILIVVVLIGASGGGEEASEPSATLPAETVVQTEAPTETTLPVETTIATIETTAPTEATTDPTEDNSKVSASTVAALIEANAAQNFSHYDISYDETGITLDVWEDGVSAGAVLAAGGSEEYLQLWDDMVSNVQAMGSATYELAKSCGRDDLVISVNVLNDTNTDNVLIMIMNGVLVYDAVNDGSL